VTAPPVTAPPTAAVVALLEAALVAEEEALAEEEAALEEELAEVEECEFVEFVVWELLESARDLLSFSPESSSLLPSYDQSRLLAPEA